MKAYLLIESRDPFESGDTAFTARLARDLAAAGHRVTVLLVQNGVLPARAGVRVGELAELTLAGIEVLVDAFSLGERGIAISQLPRGIVPAPLDVVIDRMAAGANVIWH
jgi:hypothetical protein